MFACLYVPDFPCQAALLAECADARYRFQHFPTAVIDGRANLLKVVALNDRARKSGIRLGMTKLQVEICGGIALHKRVSTNESSAHERLLACANAFSPQVESTSPGTVLLDLTGTERLFGTSDDVTRQIVHNVNGRDFVLHIAIASNPDTALYAAKGFSGITVIPNGKEAVTLSRLSVDLLPATPEMLETLQGWGIHTFKALASLPEVALTERLGQAGLHLQRLAQGRVSRTLLPIEPTEKFIENYEFDDPIETLDSLTFVLNRLLQQLCANLLTHSLATNELRLTLQLEVRHHNDSSDGEQYHHQWKLPFPTQDKNVLFALLRLDLEQQTFSAPIKKVSIEGIPIKPRLAQGNLFAPPSPEAEKLEITLARVRGFVGSTDANAVSCVGTPKTTDTHKPGSFTLEPFSSVNAPNSMQPQTLPLTLRMFRPAMETSVELAGVTPHFVRLWSKHRRVVAASGPWCSSGNWWNKTFAWAREEWDIALKTSAGIGLYRIYLDRLCGQWFVEGMFD
jgi:protein ImuB